MRIKYKIISYDDFINPTEKICSEVNLNKNVLFVEAINEIVASYNKDYLTKQIYVENLCELTWGKYLDENFIINNMQIDSYHYKWLNYSLVDIQNLFHLFDNEINIIIEGPGTGGRIDSVEGINFTINTKEKGHEHLPHIHAEYSGEEIRISLINCEILDGKGFKNNNKTKKAIAYVEENREMLLDKWTLLTGFNIPLKFSI